MEELAGFLFLIAVVVGTVIADPANAIGGTAVGFAGRQGFFGTSWPLFLGATVIVSGVAQLISWSRFAAYTPTLSSVLTGYAIGLACALVFGAKVFKLTGNTPKV